MTDGARGRGARRRSDRPPSGRRERGPGEDGPSSGGAGRADHGADGLRPLDLRLVPFAIAVWIGALAGGHLAPRHAWVCWLAVTATALPVAWRTLRGHRAVVMLTVACLAVGIVTGLSRSVHVRDGPVAELAAQAAQVRVEGVVATHPRVREQEHVHGADADAADDERAETDGSTRTTVLVRLRIDEISGRGVTSQVRTSVFVTASGPPWDQLLPGQRLRVDGRLSVAHGRDIAAFLHVRGEPELLGGAGAVARLTQPWRSGLREAAAAVPGAHRGLVPGMVIGDESLMGEDLREDMRITGLTHLTAVSGTNVSIVLLTILGTVRLIGVRGYALPAVGVIGVVAFMLLVGPEPSVLRAGVMGTVAVVGLLVAGHRRALPALAAAVIVLVLVDPWLAWSVGFALSVVATAGILILVPRWERSLAWLPRPVALAVAVPLAAQVACTPILISTFGQLSVASVPANMLAAPAVAPATVFGVAATLMSTVFPAGAAAMAWCAGVPAWWIASVARWLADQPGAEFRWDDGGSATTVASVIATLIVVALVPAMLRRPVLSAATAVVLLLVLLRAVPSPGWPPPGWAVVACDVGQGDAFLLRAGPRSAVVVDTGPDARDMRRCLDSAGIVHVPLLVLSHYHADHIGGVPGVLAGREVDEALVSPLREPVSSARRVGTWLTDAGIAERTAHAGERRVIGDELTVEVLWPRRIIRSAESDANNASVVLAADVGGVSVLLTGDIEPAGQRALLRAEPGLQARILKVPHHGSHHQDERLLGGIGADLALIGVGENAHGHPAPSVLDVLDEAGADVVRTDLDGTVAIVRRDDGLDVVRR